MTHKKFAPSGHYLKYATYFTTVVGAIAGALASTISRYLFGIPFEATQFLLALLWGAFFFFWVIGAQMGAITYDKATALFWTLFAAAYGALWYFYFPTASAPAVLVGGALCGIIFFLWGRYLGKHTHIKI